jgi:hypothetical protein
MENLTHIHNLEIFGMPTEFSDELNEQNMGAGYYKPADFRFVTDLEVHEMGRWKKQVNV